MGVDGNCFLPVVLGEEGSGMILMNCTTEKLRGLIDPLTLRVGAPENPHLVFRTAPSKSEISLRANLAADYEQRRFGRWWRDMAANGEKFGIPDVDKLADVVFDMSGGEQEFIQNYPLLSYAIGRLDVRVVLGGEPFFIPHLRSAMKRAGFLPMFYFKQTDELILA